MMYIQLVNKADLPSSKCANQIPPAIAESTIPFGNPQGYYSSPVFLGPPDVPGQCLGKDTRQISCISEGPIAADGGRVCGPDVSSSLPDQSQIADRVPAPVDVLGNVGKHVVQPSTNIVQVRIPSNPTPPTNQPIGASVPGQAPATIHQPINFSSAIFIGGAILIALYFFMEAS